MHVIDRLILAGLELGVVKVVNDLDPRRFQPSLCCLRTADPKARALLRPGIVVAELARHEGLDLSLAPKLARLLRTERIDVVHSHNWSTFLYAVAAARLSGVGAVVHGEHGRDTERAPGGRSRRIAERILASQVDHFTAVTRGLVAEMRERWRVSPDRVDYIPNGVDLRRFDTNRAPAEIRASLGVPSDAPLVGTVGAFRGVKDHETLLQAFARVKRAHPRARLLLVGDDPGRRFEASLGPRWATIGLEPGDVLFLGIRLDTPALLSILSVYVNSSRYEGMSNTLLEAMAASRAVVATAAGGNPDIVEQGVTGWLVPPGDPEGIADRIVALLDDPAAAASMGLAGRARVEERHRLSDMVAKNAQVYERVLARRPVSA